MVLFQRPFGLDFSIRSSCFNRGEGCVNKKLDHQNHIYVGTYLQLYLVALQNKKGTEGEKVLMKGFRICLKKVFACSNGLLLVLLKR